MVSGLYLYDNTRVFLYQENPFVLKRRQYLYMNKCAVDSTTIPPPLPFLAIKKEHVFILVILVVLTTDTVKSIDFVVAKFLCGIRGHRSATN